MPIIITVFGHKVHISEVAMWTHLTKAPFFFYVLLITNFDRSVPIGSHLRSVKCSQHYNFIIMHLENYIVIESHKIY